MFVLYLALFEAALVVEGKRRRSNVERFEATTSVMSGSKKKVLAECAGRGTKLGEIEYGMLIL